MVNLIYQDRNVLQVLKKETECSMIETVVSFNLFAVSFFIAG